MTTFDRDATIERRQIHEISLNVARRLRHVLDRNSYIPAALTAEVESTVRVITGIQRDIDQIMSALPADEALDFAILTHIMGGQRHALDLLEILEEKLDGGHSAYRRDSARVHQALLAVSREIEQDALRYSAEHPHAPPSAPAGSAPPAATRRGPGAPPSAPQHRQPAARGKRARPQRTHQGDGLAARLRALATRPLPVALAALAFGAGVVVGAQQMMRPSGKTAEADVAALKAPDRPPERQAPAPSTQQILAEHAAVATPNMEQPYLVVLTTRRSTEELQQDYRAFKGSYPELLGSAKARVDRVQGQDKQTWYRLSLIPPQSRNDAKALCGKLRKAGLTGCWIKSVPLH